MKSPACQLNRSFHYSCASLEERDKFNSVKCSIILVQFFSKHFKWQYGSNLFNVQQLHPKTVAVSDLRESVS